MELFWEKGYHATSMAELFARADVNTGSLYHFFPGKQDVLMAVLAAYRDGIGPMLLEPAWRGVDDPVDRVFALLGRYRQLIVQSECTYGCPIGSIALELHEPDPAVRELLAANFSAWSSAVRQQFAEAGPRLPAGVDHEALAEFALTTMEGAVMLTRTHRDVGYFDRAIAQLRDYVDRLLAAGPPVASSPSRRSRPKKSPRPAPAKRKQARKR
ncbi:MAG: TetR/AcrR family transcriptional regulator [Candidatus Eisenbacteria bacterium]|nr:TetR/AcrR family transcriptional regulator [Candidatus Eisenbacteria bacterium]